MSANRNISKIIKLKLCHVYVCLNILCIAVVIPTRWRECCKLEVNKNIETIPKYWRIFFSIFNLYLHATHTYHSIIILNAQPRISFWISTAEILYACILYRVWSTRQHKFEKPKSTTGFPPSRGAITERNEQYSHTTWHNIL